MPAFAADQVVGMSETPGVSSVTEGGVTITSTSETKEQISESLKPAPAEAEPTTEAPADDLSEAAAKLGKKGGEVAAAKRQEAKEQAETPPDPDEDDKEDEGKDKEAKKHPRSDPKARISVLVREREEARREAAQIRQEHQRLAAELEQAKAGKAPEAPKAQPGSGDDPEPDDANYEDWKLWLKDHENWMIRQALTARDKEASAKAEAQSFWNGVGRASKDFDSRINEFSKSDPTVATRIHEFAKTLKPTFLLRGEKASPRSDIAQEFFISKHGPALMMHFMDHPEEWDRFDALQSATDVMVELRLIERGLDGVTAGITSKPTVSKASAPVRPVTGSPHTVETVPGDNASYEEHKRYWGSKDRAARR